MVSRVDAKPLYYGHALLPLYRVAALSKNHDLVTRLNSLNTGSYHFSYDSLTLANITEDFSYSSANLMDDMTQIVTLSMENNDPLSEESIAVNSFHRYYPTQRAMFNDVTLSYELSKVLNNSLDNKIVHGSEAAVLFAERWMRMPANDNDDIQTRMEWAEQASSHCCALSGAGSGMSAAASFMHSKSIYRTISVRAKESLINYRNVERLLMHTTDIHVLKTHMVLSGRKVPGYANRETVEEDFTVNHNLIRNHGAERHHKMMKFASVTAYFDGEFIYLMTHDDIVNCVKTCRASYMSSLYFSTMLPKELASKWDSIQRRYMAHLADLIVTGVNFTNATRTWHVMYQELYNRIGESEATEFDGWKKRLKGYDDEIKSWDTGVGSIFRAAESICRNDGDKLNLLFLYHLNVGDDSNVKHLIDKVMGSKSKVIKPDATTWSQFMAFVDSYFMARYISLFNRLPAHGGDGSQLTKEWAQNCMRGTFNMPSRADYGKVFIKNEFKYETFANFWTLEAQDVTLATKDIGSYLYSDTPLPADLSNELIYVLTHGNVLDITDSSTPETARARIMKGTHQKNVILLAATKNESTKPSAKKRVTFSADNEFRKMQGEVDRNIRLLGSFISGPTLALPPQKLERRFRKIAKLTILPTSDFVCSHDLTSWSESQSRQHFYHFQSQMLRMTTCPDMKNIAKDWDKIEVVVNKAGTRFVEPMPESGFQGFPGSQDTLFHSCVLLYVIDTARHQGIIPRSIKTTFGTNIDDCMAALIGQVDEDVVLRFWDHLVMIYKKIGFEIDVIKSILSTIKAVYLSRRIYKGVEMPSDYKTFMKSGVSYEQGIRNGFERSSDVMQGMLGAVNYGGQPFKIYALAVSHTLFEFASTASTLQEMPPDYASIMAMAPRDDYGLGLPDIVSWVTKDCIDRRTRFNTIVVKSAYEQINPVDAKVRVTFFTSNMCNAFETIKAQEWQVSTPRSVMSDIFRAMRSGPTPPETIKRNFMVQALHELALAEPWASLIALDDNKDIDRIYEALSVKSIINAPIIAGLAETLPRSFVGSLLAKAEMSNVVMNLYSAKARAQLQRFINAASRACITHLWTIRYAGNDKMKVDSIAMLNEQYITECERNSYYDANEITVVDHTFPDPIGCLTRVGKPIGPYIEWNGASILKASTGNDIRHACCNEGLYIPPASESIMDTSNPLVAGWDPISKRIATGLAILAWAKGNGHDMSGLAAFFLKSWNINSDIDLDDEFIGSIAGSVKRLNVNPGSKSHPLFCLRNVSQHLDVNLKQAFAVLPSTGHMHDILSHVVAWRACGIICAQLVNEDSPVRVNFKWHMGWVPNRTVLASTSKMTTTDIVPLVLDAIDEDSAGFGFAQACDIFRTEVYSATLHDAWATLVNCYLAEGGVEFLRERSKMAQYTESELLAKYGNREIEVHSTMSARKRYVVESDVAFDPMSYLMVDVNPVSANLRGDRYVSSQAMPSTTLIQSSVILGNRFGAVRRIVKQSINVALVDIPVATVAAATSGDAAAIRSVQATCSSEDLWQVVLHNVKVASGRDLRPDEWHNALQSLNMPGFYAAETVDAHKLASFFGNNYNLVVSYLYGTNRMFVGHTENDFRAGPREIVVTRDSRRMNIRMRTEHVKKIIAGSVSNLDKRIELLKSNRASHRGDMRYTTDEKMRHERQIDLQVRRLMFSCVRLTAMCSLDEAKTCKKAYKMVFNAALRSLDRRSQTGAILNVPPHNGDYELDSVIDLMRACEDQVNNAGGKWSARVGVEAITRVWSWLTFDTYQASKTVFAIHPTQVTQETGRIVSSRVNQDQYGVFEDVQTVDPAVAQTFADLGTLLDMTSDFAPVVNAVVDPWQMLACAIMSGMADDQAVRVLLPTLRAFNISWSDLSKSGIEKLTAEEISAAYPTMPDDYTMGGLLWDRGTEQLFASSEFVENE